MSAVIILYVYRREPLPLSKELHDMSAPTISLYSCTAVVRVHANVHNTQSMRIDRDRDRGPDRHRLATMRPSEVPCTQRCTSHTHTHTLTRTEVRPSRTVARFAPHPSPPIHPVTRGTRPATPCHPSPSQVTRTDTAHTHKCWVQNKLQAAALLLDDQLTLQPHPFIRFC